MDIQYCPHTVKDIQHQHGLKSYCHEAGKALRQLPIDHIISVFDDFSQHLLCNAPLYKKYRHAGLPFIAEFCSASRLAALLDQALGQRRLLDAFLPSAVSGQSLAALPLGVVVHWVAGNVPTLALLSMLLALLAKNVCIVRLPSAANALAPDLLRLLATLGEKHRTVASAICLLKYSKQDHQTATMLSSMADARVIWGSSETCARIKALPSKLSCCDSIFADRVSCAIIGKDSLQQNRMTAVAARLAGDIHIFAQKACASPHTIFVEADSAQRKRFATALYEALLQQETVSPSPPPTPEETGAILKLRAHHAMLEDVLCSEGTQITILLDDACIFGTPVGNQVVYVRPLPDLATLLRHIPDNILSVGIDRADSFDENFFLALAAKGVQRFAPLGTMTRFEQPWDGVQLVHKLVRWVSAPAHLRTDA